MFRQLVYAAAVIACTQPALAEFPVKPFSGVMGQGSAVSASWDRLTQGDCDGAQVSKASPEVAAELTARLLAEELSAREGVQLMETLRGLRCTLSVPAQSAFDALIREAQVRRFDFKKVAAGEVEFVVASTMKEEWEALLDETAHLEQAAQVSAQKAPVLVIGCWIAIGTAGGLIGACINDVNDAHLDCLNGRVCTPNGPTDIACCDSKGRSDQTNCFISAGQNGPDGDYGLCCN